ncbi:MAG: IS110 family transposase [Desulfovibrio sp.]|nr:IS110 family transposase [Desulfovibrio sp.]
METTIVLDDRPICHESAIGLDVHSDNVVCCNLQKRSDGTWLQTREVFPTTYADLPNFVGWCSKFNPGAILIESTGPYWMSPYDALENAGLPISVVNPSHVKRLAGQKTDQEDAAWLSLVAVNGSYKPSYIPTQEYRNLRAVERNYTKDIQTLSGYKNRETKLFTIAGFRLDIFSDQFGQCAQAAKKAILEGKTPEEVPGIVYAVKGARRLKATKDDLLKAFNGNMTDSLKIAIESNRRLCQALEEEIKVLTDYILSEVKRLDGQCFELLKTIPGIDDMSSAIILIEIGGSENFLKAFTQAKRFASWLGLCPGNHESNSKRTGKSRRHGDWYLRNTFCEVATGASRTKNSTFKSKFQSLRIRPGYKRSIVAIAHKVAKMVYYVISNKTPYRDPQIDYQMLSCRKNQARWIKQLAKLEGLQLTAVNKKTGEVYSSETFPNYYIGLRQNAKNHRVGRN